MPGYTAKRPLSERKYLGGGERGGAAARYHNNTKAAFSVPTDYASNDAIHSLNFSYHA